MDVESDVVVGGTRRLARVDSDADTNPPPGKRLVRLERSGSRAERGGERDEQCIPLRTHLDARVRSERGAQELSVLGERASVRVAQLAQQSRRALHVCEEQRDPSRGQIRHVDMIR